MIKKFIEFIKDIVIIFKKPPTISESARNSLDYAKKKMKKDNVGED